MELHDPGAATPFDLAGAFLADVADCAAPWPALLTEWCNDRGISPELRTEIRQAVQRARVERAIGRFHDREGPS